MNAIVPSNGMQQIELMRARIDLEREILEFEKGYFEVLQASGLLPKHITKWQQFSAITSYGRMLGIDDVWTALRHIPVINGNPGPDVQLMLALIKQSGLLRDMQIDDDGRVATCTLTRVDGQTVTCTFSQEQAERITSTSWKDNKQVTTRLVDKDVWRNYPNVMRKWRAAGQAARLLFPDVINGMVKMPPGSYVVVSEDPDALMASPASKRVTAGSQLGNGNGGKERRMSDPPAAPQPSPSAGPEISEAEIVPEDAPASAFTLVKNVRTEEIGPAHIEPTAKALRAQLDAVPEDEPADKPADEKPADPKGYLMDTTLHRNNLHSWAWRTLQMHQDMVALAFDIDPKAEGWKKALDEALAKTSRSDAEEILRAFSTSDQAKTEPTPAK